MRVLVVVSMVVFPVTVSTATAQDTGLNQRVPISIQGVEDPDGPVVDFTPDALVIDPSGNGPIGAQGDPDGAMTFGYDSSTVDVCTLLSKLVGGQCDDD